MPKETDRPAADAYMYDAFISYNSIDKDWVRRLVSRLREANLKIWFDEDIRPGDAITEEIRRGIERSRRLVFVISQNSINAEFPLAEIQSVLFADPLNRKRRFIPVRIDAVELPAFLAHFSSIETARNHDWFEMLVKSCGPEAATTSGRSRFYIVDDHPIVIEGLRKLIDQQDDMQVAGSAEEADTAIRQIAELKPDVAILDITLKHGSGVDLIKKLKLSHPEMSIVVYSSHDEDVYAERCLRAGAMGYVMKGEASTRVLQGLRMVAAGSFFFSASLLGIVVSGGGSRGEFVRTLSERQLEIFEMLGRGFDSHSIAEKLGLSAKTVDAHKANIRQKLGLASAHELLMEAVRWVEK